jgi:hypothetical protein
MKFHKPFNVVERIQLLQRSILVNSFAYYELNNNILTDFQYDANARQLEELAKQYPKEFMQSRYYDYFYDFYDTDEHATSGFDLLERVRKNDKDLYRRLHMDAANALDLKRRYGTDGGNYV